MDERTRVLICLGAAIAVNCIPCFEHFVGMANSIGLTTEEIQEVVDIASQVKKGAHIAMRNSINNIIGQEEQHALPCMKQSDSSCCG